MKIDKSIQKNYNVGISNTTPVSLDKGSRVQLNAVTTPTGGIVTCSSSDSSIATVISNELVTITA